MVIVAIHHSSPFGQWDRLFLGAKDCISFKSAAQVSSVYPELIALREVWIAFFLVGGLGAEPPYI